MILIAAVFLAMQTTGVPQTPQASQAQQQAKQLAQYNFKGATAVLSGTQSAQTSKSLAPIPPLQVPPIVSHVPVAKASSPAHPAQAGSEVPFGWKPPHADLSATALNAIAVSHELDCHGIGQNGSQVGDPAGDDRLLKPDILDRDLLGRDHRT